MKNLGVFLFSAVFLCSCTAVTETPKAWLTLKDEIISDEVNFNSAMKKCDYIRADRTAKIDFDAKAVQGLLIANMCMEKEGYKLKK